MAFKGVALGLVEDPDRQGQSMRLAFEGPFFWLFRIKPEPGRGQPPALEQSTFGRRTASPWPAWAKTFGLVRPKRCTTPANPHLHPSQPQASCQPTPSLVPANLKPGRSETLAWDRPQKGAGIEPALNGKVGPFPAHKSRRMR